MDNNLQKYQAFVTTVEYGSFTKAAEVLSYSQSSISKMIADLEREWNVSLLMRDRGGVTLTSDGASLLPYAKALIDDFSRLQNRVGELNGVESGLLRIGTFSSVATHWVPKILKQFRRDYPGIEYEFLLGDYDEIEQWVREGRIDFGFLHLPTTGSFEIMEIEEDDFVVIMPKNHPLAKKEKIAPEDLNDEPFMLQERGGKTEVSEFLDTYHIHPKIIFTTWDDYAIMSMVENEFGIAVLPELILKRISYEIEIRHFTVPVRRSIGIAMRDYETLSTAAKRFLDYLKYRND